MDFIVAIVAQQDACTSKASCDFAAGLARLYASGSKNDWFLPSLYESRLIFANVSDQMWVSGRIWWSSTQHDQVSTKSYGIYVSGMEIADCPKTFSFALRPIRAF